MPRASSIFGRREMAGPVLTDEQERKRQRDIAKRETKAVEPDPLVAPDFAGRVAAAMGIGLAVRAGTNIARDVAEAAANKLPSPPAGLPPFSRVVDPLFQLNREIRVARGELEAGMLEPGAARLQRVVSDLFALLREPGNVNQEALSEIIDGFNAASRMLSPAIFGRR